MKILARILLVVFVCFLLTPPLVSLIEDDADTSSFFSFSEEEKASKEIVADFIISDSVDTIPDVEPTSNLILSENLSKHDKITSTIFLPPPNVV